MPHFAGSYSLMLTMCSVFKNDIENNKHIKSFKRGNSIEIEQTVSMVLSCYSVFVIDYCNCT